MTECEESFSQTVYTPNYTSFIAQQYSRKFSIETLYTSFMFHIMIHSHAWLFLEHDQASFYANLKSKSLEMGEGGVKHVRPTKKVAA